MFLLFDLERQISTHELVIIFTGANTSLGYEQVEPWTGRELNTFTHIYLYIKYYTNCVL